MSANTKGLLNLSTKKESAFISTGFKNWKKATGSDGLFIKHEKSECHRAAVLGNKPQTKNVAEMLNSAVTVEKKTNSAVLVKIIETLHF